MSKWVKIYAEVKLDEDTIMTAKQVKELQKRNAMLEAVHWRFLKALSANYSVIFCQCSLAVSCRLCEPTRPMG